MKKLKILALCVGFGIISSAQASFSSLMESSFGEMVNTTSPEAYNSARRGNFHGGQAFIKIPEVTVYPIQIEAPSISMGCGGIDAFFGNFSAANLDQYIKLLKASGSAVLGYGFKMAMNGFCPTCNSTIGKIEELIRDYNGMSFNSCELAKGIVHSDIGEAVTSKMNTLARNVLSAEGLWDDHAEARDTEARLKKSPTRVANENAASGSYATSIDGDTKGNITWKAINGGAFAAAYGDSVSLDDTKFLETIMSMVGSVIITADENDEPLIKPLAGNIVTLETMIFGNSDANAPSIYQCEKDTEECLEPNQNGSYPDKGLKERVESMYTDSDGMIASIAGARAWTPKAQAVLGLPTTAARICNETINGILTKDRTNVGAAKAVAQHCSEKIALEMAVTMINEHIETVVMAINAMPDKAFVKVGRNEMKENLAEVSRKYRDEYNKLLNQSGRLDFVSTLDRLLKATGSVRVAIPNSAE